MIFNKKLKEEIKYLKRRIEYGQETLNMFNRKLDDKTRDARRVYAENNDLKALIKTLKQKNTRLINKLKEYDRKTLDEAIKDAMKNGFKKDPNAKEITIVGLHSEGQEYHIPNTLIDIDDNGVETHTLPFIVTDNDKKRVEETKKQLKNKVGKPRKKDK